MKNVSIDNGRTYGTAEEMISEILSASLWEAVAASMDDEIREQVAYEGIESEAEFLARYLELADEDLVIG